MYLACGKLNGCPCFQTPQRITMSDNLFAPLAGLGGERPPCPAWFTALALSSKAAFVIVDGTPIEYYIWGEFGAPGVLLVHGSRAHAHWWGPVAPLLAQAGFRVVSMSFSGHGGSGWRAAYSTDQLVAEMFAVAAAAQLSADGAKFSIGAHSFGGLAAIVAAKTHGAALEGVITVDSMLLPFANDLPPNFSRAQRSYPSLAAGLARFRLAPLELCENLYLLDETARHALVEENGTWRWRFDPTVFDRLTLGDSWGALAAPDCRIACIFGETSSIVTPQRLTEIAAQAPLGTPFIGIPQAGHHVMLDQPLALATAMRTVLACWRAEISRL
jgi:pimeloyl-ACP methyl ester carboxylesterase